MKLIERIRWINKHMKEPCLVVRGEEFNKVAILALKNDPLKPRWYDGDTFRCAICNTAVVYKACVPGGVEGEVRDKYCSICGQAIDWSGIDGND